MAATVYDWKDGLSFTGAASTDNAALIFTLLGGRYGVGVNATWSAGNAVLQIRMPDGSTYVTALTAFTADGVAVVDLPPGAYRIVITTSTAVQGFVVRIPYRAA